jgi:hypothetical protein
MIASPIRVSARPPPHSTLPLNRVSARPPPHSTLPLTPTGIVPGLVTDVSTHFSSIAYPKIPHPNAGVGAQFTSLRYHVRVYLMPVIVRVGGQYITLGLET